MAAADKKNILLQWFSWHFFEMPREILKGWANFLLFNLEFFSIPLLFKTLFAPWHQYLWSYGRGFDLGRYIEVFFSNLISRVIGAILRSFLIIVGLIGEIFIIFLGTIVFLGWIVLPILLILGWRLGFKILL